MILEYGDIVVIDGSYYVFVDDKLYDVNGGGYLTDLNYAFEKIVNIAPFLQQTLQESIGILEYKLTSIQEILGQ